MDEVERAPRGRRFRAESGAQAAAAGLACVVLALGGAIFAVDSHFRQPDFLRIDPVDAAFHGPQQVLTHFSSVIPFFDSRGQTLAHLAMVGLAGLLVAAIGGFGWTCAFARDRRFRWSLGAGLALLCTLLLAEAIRQPRYLGLSLGLPALLLLHRWGRPILHGRGNAGLLGTGLVLLALATLPALFLRIDLSERSWSRIVFIQYHYSAVLGAADQLAAGSRLFTDVFPNYGALLPVLTAAIQRRVGPWSMGDYLRFLQALQVVYLLLAAWLYHRHARGRWAFALPALLLVLPWYHFAGKGLYFPNQTPWRAIGVPLAAALLALLARRGLEWTAAALGAAGAVALLLNFETGLAVVAGFAAYLFFRHGARPGHGLLRLLGLGLLGAGAALALFVVGHQLALGRTVDFRGLLALGWRAGRLGVTGWNGLPLTAAAWPALVFGHALFVLLYTALKTPPPAPVRACFRAFVATTLLAWFAYFAYRPSEWGLSSYYLLYGFLVIDALRYLARELFARRRVNPLLAFALAAALLMGLPRIAVSNARAGEQAWLAVTTSARAQTWPPALEVSGFLLPRPGAEEALAKARFLRAAARRGPPLYFTSDLYLVPKLSGVLSGGLPLGMDLEMITRDGYARVLQEVVASPQTQVLFDAPGTEADRASLLRSFFHQIRQDLSPYFAPVRVQEGWEIWQRVRPGADKTPVRTVSIR